MRKRFCSVLSHQKRLMFTGIIQSTSRVLRTHTREGCRVVRIQRPSRWTLIQGQSIAIDGICSTIVACKARHFDVEYTHQTLLKTTAGLFDKGSVVNLERSLTLNTFVDGHMVMGHIDARAHVARIVEKGASRELVIHISRKLVPLIAPQGSVTVNGVALTVARVRRDTFTVALIPHTAKKTNLGTLRIGDVVNVEIDILARYVAAALKSGRVAQHATKRVRKRR